MSAATLADDALVAAIEARSLDAMRDALRAGVEPDESQYALAKLIIRAARSVADLAARDAWSLDALKLLEGHGWRPYDGELDEALWEAVTHSAGPAVVRHLVQSGAGVNLADRFGIEECPRDDTRIALVQALAASCVYSRSDSLIGSDYVWDNASCEYVIDMKYLLVWSLEGHRVRTLDALVRSGVADLNAVDGAGRTLLHIEADKDLETRGLEQIRDLLDYGADPTIRDRYGRSPLDVVTLPDVDLYVAGPDSDEAEKLDAKYWREDWLSTLQHLLLAEAWWRRRHMLLAVRGRYDPPAAPTPATDTLAASPVSPADPT